MKQEGLGGLSHPLYFFLWFFLSTKCVFDSCALNFRTFLISEYLLIGYPIIIKYYISLTDMNTTILFKYPAHLHPYIMGGWWDGIGAHHHYINIKNWAWDPFGPKTEFGDWEQRRKKEERKKKRQPLKTSSSSIYIYIYIYIYMGMYWNTKGPSQPLDQHLPLRSWVGKQPQSKCVLIEEPPFSWWCYCCPLDSVFTYDWQVDRGDSTKIFRKNQ